MKLNLTAFLLISSLFLMGFDNPSSNSFQLITSDPHHLEKIEAHVQTIHQSGRLRVVEVKVNAPRAIYKYLRPIKGQEKSYLYRSRGFIRQIDKEIKHTLSLVDSELIKKDVVALSSYTTRLVNTDDNRKATAVAQEKLAQMGYEVQQICYREGACSVIADKLGSTHPEKVILVMAHIDSVGAKFAGADDNASGTAALLEMARVLKDGENKKTIRFFITNGEESGLLGAKHYASELKRSNKIKEIVLAINMDMVGYNANGIVELETDAKLESLAKWFADLAAGYTNLKTKITLGAWGSDHVPFLEAGTPTLLTIENWDTKTPCYHQACDKPETLNYAYAAEITKLNVAAVMTKDLE